jgi:hypothetical protein
MELLGAQSFTDFDWFAVLDTTGGAISSRLEHAFRAITSSDHEMRGR